MIVYDIEIIKGIPDKRNPKQDDIEYCKGWTDHANMGISVIGVYDYYYDEYRVFCDDNIYELAMLIDERDTIVGFNNIGFDNKVMAHNGFNVDVLNDKSFDVLVEIWRGAGLGPTFKFPSHIGYSLDAVCKANMGTQKTGHGAQAPIMWQRGQVGGVIDYCLHDVKMTKDLVDYITQYGAIKSPKNGNLISVKSPMHEG